MEAVGLTEFGGPDVLHRLDLPVPEAEPGQIRIRLCAATVNPVDIMGRRSLAFLSDAQPPYDTGADVVLPRGGGFADLVRKEAPGGVDVVVDTGGMPQSAARAVLDGGRIVTSAPGASLVTERTFVPSYARNHAAFARLCELAEQGRITLRVARTLPPRTGGRRPPIDRGRRLARSCRPDLLSRKR